MAQELSTDQYLTLARRKLEVARRHLIELERVFEEEELHVGIRLGLVIDVPLSGYSTV